MIKKISDNILRNIAIKAIQQFYYPQMPNKQGVLIKQFCNLINREVTIDGESEFEQQV